VGFLRKIVKYLSVCLIVLFATSGFVKAPLASAAEKNNDLIIINKQYNLN
jgi:hypothetical protein